MRRPHRRHAQDAAVDQPDRAELPAQRRTHRPGERGRRPPRRSSPPPARARRRARPSVRRSARARSETSRKTTVAPSIRSPVRSGVTCSRPAPGSRRGAAVGCARGPRGVLPSSSVSNAGEEAVGAAARRPARCGRPLAAAGLEYTTRPSVSTVTMPSPTESRISACWRESRSSARRVRAAARPPRRLRARAAARPRKISSRSRKRSSRRRASSISRTTSSRALSIAAERRVVGGFARSASTWRHIRSTVAASSSPVDVGAQRSARGRRAAGVVRGVGGLTFGARAGGRAWHRRGPSPALRATTPCGPAWCATGCGRRRGRRPPRSPPAPGVRWHRMRVRPPAGLSPSDVSPALSVE